MSAGSVRRTWTMADGNGARGVCSVRRNCTRAEGNPAGDTGSLRRHCNVRICDRRRRSPWAHNRCNLCCVIGQVGSRYTINLRNKRRGPDSTVGGRVGCAAPPSNCHLPVRKVTGWRAFGFPLGLWATPRRIPGTAAGAKEAGEGGTPPWWPDVYGCRGYRCDYLPDLGPGGTPAFDLNDCDDFSWCVPEKTCRRRGS